MEQFTSLQHREDFLVRAYEVDHRKRATVPALVKLMHEAAMQNVLRLRISVWDLEPQGISWVLMRKRLHIDRLPDLGESIHILTYPAGFEKFFTYRDYRILDQQGRQIAWSSSTWLLMDTQTRRMTRIPESILHLKSLMPDPERCLPRPGEKLPRMEESSLQDRFKVQFFDLDFNRHLNNTLYLKWMLETAPEETLQKDSLQSFDIVYRNECYWRDEIRAELCRQPDGSFLHRLLRVSDGLELALGHSHWAKAL